MRIRANIVKEGAWWVAEAQAADLGSQGKTEAKAAMMLAEVANLTLEGVKLPGRMRVAKDAGGWFLECDNSASFAAIVLRRQRRM